MHTTNYSDTLILVSPDCRVDTGRVPSKPGTVAATQHVLLRDAPYRMTSDDLLVAVEARRRQMSDAEQEALRAEFFAKPRACLRASPLVKSYGWGIHHDASGRIALVGCETAEYRRLSDDPAIAKRPGMRSRRS